MKLVKTAPRRILNANGKTFRFSEEGLCLLPDEVARTLPKAIYSIVDSLPDDEEAATARVPSKGPTQSENVVDVTPAPSEIEEETSEAVSEHSSDDDITPSEDDSADTVSTPAIADGKRNKRGKKNS